MRRLKDPNVIPFGVALQALAIFVASFFLSPSTSVPTDVTGVGSDGDGTKPSLSSLSELPRDLQREYLPVPRVPERDKRPESDDPPQPTPANDDGNQTQQSGDSLLASLRTQNVSLSGPVAIPISAPILGVPDSLDGLSLAGGGWLGGGTSSSTRRRGRGGGPSDMGGGGAGGRGIGGFGGGSGGGGYCPTPGRIGGGSGGRSGGGGRVASGGTGRSGGGGGGTKTTGTSSGGTRGRPAGPSGGGATRGKPKN